MLHGKVSFFFLTPVTFHYHLSCTVVLKNVNPSGEKPIVTFLLWKMDSNSNFAWAATASDANECMSYKMSLINSP